MRCKASVLCIKFRVITVVYIEDFAVMLTFKRASENEKEGITSLSLDIAN